MSNNGGGKLGVLRLSALGSSEAAFYIYVPGLANHDVTPPALVDIEVDFHHNGTNIGDEM